VWGLELGLGGMRSSCLQSRAVYLFRDMVRREFYPALLNETRVV